jgi:phosphotransferase system enzyme I (PtsP)
MAVDSSINLMMVSRQVDGVSLNTGIGLGRAVVHQQAGVKMARRQEDLKSHSNTSELIHLDQAFIYLVEEIQGLLSRKEASLPTTIQSQSQVKSLIESREILDVHLLLARDPGWKRQLRERIQGGMTAITAVDQTLQSIREKLEGKGAQFHWQERISDFEDLSERLKRHLVDSVVPKNWGGDSPIIVVADRIGPAELLDYERNRLVGLVLVEQSQTSHVAIVARSLNIPVVGGMKDLLQEIRPGDSLLVDGNEGRVYIRPVKEVISRYDTQFQFKKTRHFDLSEAPTPLLAKTLDGVSISLLLNAGLVEDVDHIEATGAEGIGLYRTEIPFMIRPRLPNIHEQVKLYREILKRAGRHPVVFRTLDVGGDKVLPYLERLKSEGPIKKRRTESIIFDHPILLRYQLRALIRASTGSELTIMLPMIAEVSEVQAARQLLDGEINREKEKGNPVPTRIKLGAMVEVPSLVYQLPQLFPHVDFLSVGSNDLFQFFYAIDRDYPQLTDRYDVLSPTFLSMLKSIQDQAKAAGIPLSVCGEMAGRPLEALALIGLGYRTLSMSAPAVPIVRNMIRNLVCQEISDYMGSVCIASHANIRQNLHDFARDHGIYKD